METAKQGYWKREHKDKKYGGCSASNEKRQYHKSRRRHDTHLIENQLSDIVDEHKLLCDIFGNGNPNKYCKV